MAKPNITQTSAEDGGGEDRVNVFRRSGQFLIETVHELKRVNWPGRKEVVNYTVAALLTCMVMGALVFGFDIGVSKIMSLLGIGV